MKVIGLAGQMRSGKDTCADYLASKLCGWKRVAFAAQVKRVYCDTFGVDLDFIETWKTNPEPPPNFLKNVRKGLQFIGDGFREIQGDIWVDLCFRKNEPPMIISDTRYVNELRKIREVGGMSILVLRPGFENDDPNGSEAQIKPAVDFFSSLPDKFEGSTAEMLSNLTAGDRAALPPGVEYVDYFLRNEGTKEDLYAKIDGFLMQRVLEKFGCSSPACGCGHG